MLYLQPLQIFFNFSASIIILTSFNKIDKKDNILITSSTSQIYSTKNSVKVYCEYTNYLPLYDQANGKLIRKFRFEDDPEYDFGGGFVIQNSKDGWLQIQDLEFYPELNNLWTLPEYLFISSNNYNNSIPLYKEADYKSEIGVQLHKEMNFNVIGVHLDWAQIIYQEDTLWLAPKYQCANPVTNCN